MGGKIEKWGEGSRLEVRGARGLNAQILTGKVTLYIFMRLEVCFKVGVRQKKRFTMNVKTTIAFVVTLFSAMFVCSCSGEASTNRSPEIANNEVLLQLDSLSPCATNDQLDSIENVDTLFIVSKDGKTSFVFPAQISWSRDSIESIGVESRGDTLVAKLLIRENTPDMPLDCPVWVYSTVKGTIDEHYAITPVGPVHTLIKK